MDLFLNLAPRRVVVARVSAPPEAEGQAAELKHEDGVLLPVPVPLRLAPPGALAVVGGPGRTAVVRRPCVPDRVPIRREPRVRTVRVVAPHPRVEHVLHHRRRRVQRLLGPHHLGVLRHLEVAVRLVVVVVRALAVRLVHHRVRGARGPGAEVVVHAPVA